MFRSILIRNLKVDVKHIEKQIKRVDTECELYKEYSLNRIPHYPDYLKIKHHINVLENNDHQLSSDTPDWVLPYLYDHLQGTRGYNSQTTKKRIREWAIANDIDL